MGRGSAEVIAGSHRTVACRQEDNAEELVWDLVTFYSPLDWNTLKGGVKHYWVYLIFYVSVPMVRPFYFWPLVILGDFYLSHENMKKSCQLVNFPLFEMVTISNYCQWAEASKMATTTYSLSGCGTEAVPNN